MISLFPMCRNLMTWVALNWCIPSFAVTKPVLNDWFALGSGCRAKSDLPGNVRMETLASDPSRPNTYRVRFVFSGLELKGDTADSQVMQFARECAVRLNINPPAGRRIVDVKAETAVVASKDLGATLDINAELKIGATSLGSVRRTLASNARAQPIEEKIELASSSSKDKSLPELSCGESKIIGFDYSWIVKRDQKQITSLSVELGQEKSLIVEAALAACN
jgi:hypothetical protein